MLNSDFTHSAINVSQAKGFALPCETGTGGVHYFEQLALRVSFLDSAIRVMWIDNAQKRGAVCRELTFHCPQFICEPTLAERVCDAGYNTIDKLHEFASDLFGIVTDCGTVATARDELPTLIAGVVFNVREIPAMAVYSPFVKPSRLKAAPKKWTMATSIKALLTGQFKDALCKGQYTDDFAGDAAGDYGRGPLTDIPAFVCKIIEDRSGWWCSGDEDGLVRVCCHHFNSNAFTFDLDGGR